MSIGHVARCLLSEIRSRILQADLCSQLTGKRLVTRSIPDWRSYWYSACYSVPVSQAGCNGRVASFPFFFFSELIAEGIASQCRMSSQVL